MTYPDVQAPSVDSGPANKQEEKQPSGRLRTYWREIEAYKKTASEWREQSEKIVKLYLDQHRTAASPRRFALLWSNIETLKPAVYAKMPTVLCSRRYKDPHPVGRTAAELLERATNATFDLYRVDEIFRMVRDDRLLTSRGQAWVRYEADFKKGKDDKGAEYDKVAGERVCIDYVDWRDFGHNVAGTWHDVWLVWRRVYKNRDEVEERFGKDIVAKLTFTTQTDYDGNQLTGEPQACLYEVWDKQRNRVVFLAKEYPELIEDGPPPLNFRDFFPCPEPCYGSKTAKSLIPTPDYRYYQDQANEIDDLTDKIANLTEFLQVRAFVPAGPSSEGSDAVRIMIQTLQNDMTSNRTVFIPVESWAGFAEKGGAGKLIDWMPIDIIIKALEGAIQARNQLVQDVYQITGIADILRGQTDPNETLGAQELKAQTGQRRVRNARDELARFCRDIAQLVAEVIAEQFQPRTIADMTGYAYVPAPPMLALPMPGMAPQMQPPPGMPNQMPGGQPMALGQNPMQPGQPPMAQQPPQIGPPESPSGQTFGDAELKLLRDDRMRGFLIDIETDSTIQPDEDAEKQRRTEFITALGGFLNEAGQVLPGAPALAPMISESLLFMVRGFRAGRSLEEVIERSMQQLGQQLSQPKPPDPKAQAEQAKAQSIQMQAQADQQQTQGEMALNQQELQIKQQELAMKERELAMKERELTMKAQFAEQESALRQREIMLNAQASERQHELGQESLQAKHDTGMEMLAARAAQALQPKPIQ